MLQPSRTLQKMDARSHGEHGLPASIASRDLTTASVQAPCKICGSSRLTVFAHTAKCGDCGVLLYWPYPKSDAELMQGEGKAWSPDRARDWYSKSSFYNHTNFTNMLRFTLGEESKNRRLDILDYGGGAGQFALVALSHFPEARVFITDMADEALLDEWRPFNTQIPFRQFADDRQTFDAIFLNDVFEHVSDPVVVLQQLAAKLKPGGRMFIDTPKQFWLFGSSRLFWPALHRKILQGTVSTAHLQIWTRQAFERVVRDGGLRISKYTETSEYTMPPEFYLKNMGIQQPLVRACARLFYRNAKYLAKNKIMCVLSPAGA